MTPARPQEYPPLQGAQRTAGTIALSAAVFMNVLDTSIANVSIPAIAGDLGASTTQGTWVITSFAVANAISLPLTGWLTRRVGQVRLFVWSVLLFVMTSWLCGLAPSLEALVFFRVLQGLVAGPMIPLSQTLMLASYPKAKAGMALALWSMTTLVAPVAGPLLGGWISDNYTWPWIFYINVPVGILAAWASFRIYRHRESPTEKMPIDGVGLALLVIWVASLQTMLDMGKELGWFDSTQVWLLAITAGVSFVFFLIWELTEKHPIVDLRLFAGRNFTTGVVTLSVAYGVFFGTVVILPLWLQTNMGYTATHAGMVTAPVGILAILLTPVVGRLLASKDPRMLVTVAFLIFAVVSYLRAGFNTQVDMRTIVIPTIIQGAAMAAFFVPLTSITLSGLSPDKIPNAAGLSNFVRMTAGAFGTSLVTTTWEDRTTLHHAQLVESLHPGNQATDQALTSLQALGLSWDQAVAMLENMVHQQAATLSATDIFRVSTIIFVILIGTVWFARPRRAAGSAEEAASGAH